MSESVLDLPAAVPTSAAKTMLRATSRSEVRHPVAFIPMLTLASSPALATFLVAMRILAPRPIRPAPRNF
eukprot:673229-Pyramimonas_sp.AAC.1